MLAECKIISMIVITWIAAEAIKLATDAYRNKKVKFRVLLGYGGFPSAHATVMTSLSTSIYLVNGMTTPFIIAFVLTILVIRDVIIMRRAVDTNTAAISKLSKNKLKGGLISHSYVEIVAGITLGIIGPLILNAII